MCSALSYIGPPARTSYHSPQPKPITAAVHTRHSISLKNVDLPKSNPISPGTIEVKGAVPSFVIKFNSASSKLNLFHEHQPGKVPVVKETFSEDAPHILKHSVRRPIYQQVIERIFPSRRIIQQINPVIESIRTIVATSKTAKQSTSSLSHPQVTSQPIAAPKLPVDTFERAQVKVSQGNEKGEDDVDEKPEPDLVLNETNLIDNSLYNGNSELDLKYISPNGKSLSKDSYNDYQNDYNFLNSPRLYKDRRWPRWTLLILL